MTTRFDPKRYAATAIQYGFEKLKDRIDGGHFFDDLSDKACEYVPQEADNACCYVSGCTDIISRFETEYGDSEYDDGRTYKAHEFSDAMVSYAKHVAGEAITAELESAITELREAWESLSAMLPAGVTAELVTDCAYGWAAHAYESAEGVCVWHRLEGSTEARAIACGGFWIQAGWTPAHNREEG